MKKPEEINRRLDLCRVESGTCEGCPYFEDEHCISHGNLDALAYIRQLEAQVEHVTRERDAALADLVKALKQGDAAIFCDFCKHSDEARNCDDPCYPYNTEKSRWEWRGLPEER